MTSVKEIVRQHATLTELRKPKASAYCNLLSSYNIFCSYNTLKH